MKVARRQQRILQQLLQTRTATIQQLAEMFQVSDVTIRNDLRVLEQQGKLIRTHGGATIGNVAGAPLGVESPDEDRYTPAQLDNFQRMAQRAASLVGDDETIVLLSGPITYAMMNELLRRRSITVLTNSLRIAAAMHRNPSNTVVLLGGQLRGDGETLDGPVAIHTLSTLQAQKAFLSFDGFNPRQGLADDDIAIAQLKTAVLSAAQSVIAIGSADRVGRSALMSFGDSEHIHHLITTEGAPAGLLSDLRASGVQVTVCSQRLTEIAADTGDEQRWRIGFANLNEQHEFAVSVRQGVEQAVKDLRHFELVIADNAGDSEAALANAQAMLERHVDLLIEYQQDEHTNNVLMDMCRKAGVPVIAIDIPLPGATYFGADNYRAGAIAADAAVRWIQKHWQGQLDRVVVLEQTESGSVPATRIQAQIDRLRQAFDLRNDQIIRCDTHGDLHGSQLASIQALRSIPWNKRVLFVGINFNSALGSLSAAEALDRQANTAVVAQNASARIRRELRRNNRMLIGAVDFFPQHYGSKVIPLALSILSGRPVPPAVYTDHLLITAQNVNQVYPDEVAQDGPENPMSTSLEYDDDPQSIRYGSQS